MAVVGTEVNEDVDVCVVVSGGTVTVTEIGGADVVDGVDTPVGGVVVVVGG